MPQSLMAADSTAQRILGRPSNMSAVASRFILAVGRAKGLAPSQRCQLLNKGKNGQVGPGAYCNSILLAPESSSHIFWWCHRVATDLARRLSKSLMIFPRGMCAFLVTNAACG